MEANFFRHLCRALGPRLIGLRLEKIHSPLDGTWTFSLQTSREAGADGGGKRCLLLRSGPGGGLLCLSTNKPANPLVPSARVMWLRKRAAGRRILAAIPDWPRRRLALELSPRDSVPGSGRYLLLDLKTGPDLVDSLPDTFGSEPVWPDLEEVLRDKDLWQRHPQVSPPLRKTLAALPEAEARSLLERLHDARTDAYHLYTGPDGPAEVLPWPLPVRLRQGLAEHICPDPLAAAATFGEGRIFAAAGLAETADDRARDKAHTKRLKRNLARLDEDERRHTALAGLAIQAEALQASLHTLRDRPLAERMELLHSTRGPVAVDLDPRLLPSENMERLFRLAAKGRRGLVSVEERRRTLLAVPVPTPSPTVAPSPRPVFAPQPKRYKNLAVRVYRTSDGFTALRGKNDKANHDLLGKAASPFDLWFHVLDGPGAHVILKRDSPNHDVPRTSLEEAAALAALASYRASDQRAEVACALVKDVRKIKGAALGLVRIDEVREVILVTLDPGLEARLRQ